MLTGWWYCVLKCAREDEDEGFGQSYEVRISLVCSLSAWKSGEVVKIRAKLDKLFGAVWLSDDRCMRYTSKRSSRRGDVVGGREQNLLLSRKPQYISRRPKGDARTIF